MAEFVSWASSAVPMLTLMIIGPVLLCIVGGEIIGKIKVRHRSH